MSGEGLICEHGGKRGLFLPLSEHEADLSIGARIAIYGLCLLYCFFGVSVAADIFMSSIEAITSRRTQKNDRTGKRFTFKVWNGTVANLSLMALGSSAPEIFLSVIDLLRNEFYAGDLGPSTIVGSAAFNLFVIVAVCMLAIPSGDGRAVEQVSVFIVTAVFSFLAYVWLAVIVLISTPDIVDVWEAVVTFAFLPLLIWISWRVDLYGMHGFLPGAARRKEQAREVQVKKQEDPCPERAKTMLRAGRQTQVYDTGPRGNQDQKHELIKTIIAGKVRAAGTQRLGRGATGAVSSATLSSSDRLSRCSNCTTKSQVQFLVDHQHMSQNLDMKPVWLVRHGDLTHEVRIEYSVQELDTCLPVPPVVRTAPEVLEQWGPVLTPSEQKSRAEMFAKFKARSNVVAKSGDLTLLSGEDQKELLIPRPASQDFVLELLEASSPTDDVRVGPISMSQVKTVPANSRGKIKFAVGHINVIGKEAESTAFEVVACRIGGTDGPLSCNYRTEPLSALPDFHYEPIEGQLDFADGVTEARFDMQVLPIGSNRCPKDFIVILDDPDSPTPAEFDVRDDGGETASILTVHIETPPGSGFWRWLDGWVGLDAIHLGNEDWWEHTRSVFFVGGSEEEQKDATWITTVLHMFAFPWKVFFVLAPSIHYLGGWVCFSVSLLYIALLTGIIADLADLFGCVLGIRDMVTAITFVALGTSMPDLFASKGAAQEDPTADASIVNVTGSNSVNVFLGLGLPWTIGALYWEFSGRKSAWEARYPSMKDQIPYPKSVFVVEGADLGFNVASFSVCCLLSFIMLGLKRQTTGVELGGPAGVNFSVAVVFIVLWVGYIVLAIWRSTPRSTALSAGEEMLVMGGVTGVILLSALIAIAFMVNYHLRHGGSPPKEETQVEPAVLVDPGKTCDSVEMDAPEDSLREGSGEVKPPFANTEAPSGSRGRCFAKS